MDRKATIGQAYRFFWEPVDGHPSETENPEVVVQWPSGPVTYVLTRVRTDVGVTGPSSDRRVLTAATALLASTRGLTGDNGGAAWLDGGAVFQGPVRVLRVVSDGAGTSTLELAAPLPHAVTLPASSRLFWTLHAVQIPAVDAGAAVLRNVRWSLTWVPRAGADFPVDPVGEQGLLHVVRAPFATGLTDAGVNGLWPQLARMVPGTQQGWSVQRDLALDELAELVRAALQERWPDNYEDDVAGEAYRLPHALLTGAIIFGARDVEGDPDPDKLRERAIEAIRARAARPGWVDVNQDGEVDDAEVVGASNLAGLLSSNVTASDYVAPDMVQVGDDR